MPFRVSGHQKSTLVSGQNGPMLGSYSRPGGVQMTASQVILHFDKQEDALRFMLAASSVMYADGALRNEALTRIAQEIRKASRITTEGAVESSADSVMEFTPQEQCA